jgi:hypothetical protein
MSHLYIELKHYSDPGGRYILALHSRKTQLNLDARTVHTAYMHYRVKRSGEFDHSDHWSYRGFGIYGDSFYFNRLVPYDEVRAIESGTYADNNEGAA